MKQPLKSKFKKIQSQDFVHKFRKENIQRQLKQEIGLLADLSTQGTGTTKTTKDFQPFFQAICNPQDITCDHELDSSDREKYTL